MSPALTLASTTKAKSRVTGWNADNSSIGLARVGFAFGSGMRSRITSNAISGPSASSASSARGCSSPKWPSTFCGPIWIVPERPGCSQAGPAGHDLQRLRRCAGRDEHGERVGLHVEHIGRAVAAPVPPRAGGSRERAAHAGRGGELVLRLVAAEHLPDLEQRRVGKAAVGVLLRRCDQARNEARPHVGEVRGDRVGERKLRLSAAEQF